MKKYMTKQEIIKALGDLAKSTGLYGRILRDMTEDALDELERQHFTDALDLVMFIEG